MLNSNIQSWNHEDLNQTYSTDDDDDGICVNDSVLFTYDNLFNENFAFKERQLDEMYKKYGKEYINQTFSVDAKTLFQYMYEKNDFFESFWISRKFCGKFTN